MQLRQPQIDTLTQLRSISRVNIQVKFRDHWQLEVFIMKRYNKFPQCIFIGSKHMSLNIYTNRFIFCPRGRIVTLARCM